jgi:hypothetical protein
VVRREISFQEQLLDIAIGKREPQIPTDGANNDLGFEVPPAEECWPSSGHDTPYRIRSIAFVTKPYHQTISPVRTIFPLAEFKTECPGCPGASAGKGPT